MAERTKIILLGDRFSTGEPTVQPVVLWGSRSKPFYERMSKEASASPAMDYIKSVQPMPGRTIVLIIGLGSYEYYGLNRNSDGFPEEPYQVGRKPTCGCCGQGRDAWVLPEETIQHHYKSYEHGHVYRHHCFPAGSPVTLADHTRVPIETVNKGDLVETRQGGKRVTDTFSRFYEGPGVSLTLQGEMGPLIGTANHEVLVFRREQIHCRHGYNRLSPSAHIAKCHDAQKAIGEANFVSLDTVVPGDYLLYPRPFTGTEHVDENFARAVGWVASEGYLGKTKNAIKFTFSEKNHADITAVTVCFEKLGHHVCVSPRPQYGLVELNISSKELHTHLSEYIQGTKAEKCLTSRIFNWDITSIRTCLQTYIEGDGHVLSIGGDKGHLMIRSSSPDMLHILADLIRALGIFTTCNWDRQAGTMLSPTNGKTYNDNGSGMLHVRSGLAPQLTQGTRKYVKPLERHVWTPNSYNDWFLLRVNEREDIFLKEQVYNLEVEDVNEYMINGVIVHNCNKDPQKAIGKIHKAFWSPFMHRIEVLQDIENDKAPDLVERIADGEFLACSMGCRIKWDVCTHCGHMSPTRKEYCSHCMYEIGQLDPHTGIRNGTLNPSPKFFDSSFVYKPADRTGYMLKKVAEHAYELQNSSELGEIVDSLNAKAAAAKKVAVIDKLVRGYPAGVVQSELPEAGLIQHYCHTSLPTVVERTQELPMKDLESLAPHNLGHTLASLSRAGIILTTPEFINLFMAKAAPGVTVPPDVLNNLTAMQGELFELFGQHPSLLDDTLSSLTPTGTAAPSLTNTVQSLLEKRSTLGEYVQRRLTPWTFRMEEPALSDVVEVEDPSSGRVYQTTRGAMRLAHDEIAKSQLRRLVGGAGLLAAATKVVAGSPGLALPLTIGSAYLGKTGLEPMPSYKSTTGEDVPYLTEFQEKRSHVLDLVNVLGQDYRVTKQGMSRLQTTQCRSNPATPLHRVFRKLSSFGLDSQGLSLEHMVISSKYASDGIRDEQLDFEKVADVIGTLAWGI